MRANRGEHHKLAVSAFYYVNGFFADDFSPAVELSDRDGPLLRRSDALEAARGAKVRPVGLRGRSHQRVQGISDERNRKNSSHSDRSDPEQPAEKSSALNSSLRRS